jgi:hypothetical protein
MKEGRKKEEKEKDKEKEKEKGVVKLDCKLTGMACAPSRGNS